MKNKKGLLALAKKAGTIFATAIAALSLTEAKALPAMEADNVGNILQITGAKRKTISVLKLNTSNPENSKFVASHASHKSHSSHSSHRSHSSHYSRR